MRHKTAVRLALKVLGVFLITQGLIHLGHTAAYAVLAALEPRVESFSWATFGRPAMVHGGLHVLIGLYFFLGGRLVVDRIIPSNRPYCAECGYELTGLPSDGQCPECGQPFRRPAPRPTAGTAPEVLQ